MTKQEDKAIVPSDKARKKKPLATAKKLADNVRAARGPLHADDKGLWDQD
jgi:hypothetical protein